LIVHDTTPLNHPTVFLNLCEEQHKSITDNFETKLKIHSKNYIYGVLHTKVHLHTCI